MVGLGNFAEVRKENIMKLEHLPPRNELQGLEQAVANELQCCWLEEALGFRPSKSPTEITQSAQLLAAVRQDLYNNAGINPARAG